MTDIDVIELDSVTIIHVPEQVDGYVVLDGELPTEVGE
jgi:hypothetical protein